MWLTHVLTCTAKCRCTNMHGSMGHLLPHSPLLRPPARRPARPRRPCTRMRMINASMRTKTRWANSRSRLLVKRSRSLAVEQRVQFACQSLCRRLGRPTGPGPVNRRCGRSNVQSRRRSNRRRASQHAVGEGGQVLALGVGRVQGVVGRRARLAQQRHLGVESGVCKNRDSGGSNWVWRCSGAHAIG